MSINEIAFAAVSLFLILTVPPMMYAGNTFGATIRTWIPDQGNRERFIMSGVFTTAMMAVIATTAVFFESARSISGMLFIATITALGITIAVKEADKHHTIHLFVYWLYTGAYSIASIALLYAYGFVFSVDTPWVLAAILSSIFVGTITSEIMTTKDKHEEKKLKNALVAFITFWVFGLGICLVTINMAVGLLVIGIIVTTAGIIQHIINDDWAILSLPFGIILLFTSAVSFMINTL